MASPGYRYWALCRSKRGDPIVEAILDGKVDSDLLDECKEIYEDKIIKIYVEASLLATTDYQAISNALEISEDALKLYHDVYYDVHSLSRVKKVRHLADIKDEDELSLKKWSLSSGMEFVQWRLGLSSSNNMMSNLVQLQADAYFRSREAFFNGNNTDAAAEGLKWSRQAAHLTKLIDDMTGEPEDAASDDLLLELEKLNEDTVVLNSIHDLESL